MSVLEKQLDLRLFFRRFNGFLYGDKVEFFVSNFATHLCESDVDFFYHLSSSSRLLHDYKKLNMVCNEFKSAPTVRYPSFVVRGDRHLCSAVNHRLLMSSTNVMDWFNCPAISSVVISCSKPNRIKSKFSYLAPYSSCASWSDQRLGDGRFATISAGTPTC